MTVLRLEREQLVELAELVAESLAARLASAVPGALVDAATLAERLGVERSFVYEHSGELGGVRLGDGPRGRLRFDPVEAGRRLASCQGSRGSSGAEAVSGAGSRRRRRPSSGSAAPLLPVQGEDRG